jgi:hypothetical protein
VVIGGSTTGFLGATGLTEDADCVVRRERANLENFASTLREFHARTRVARMSNVAAGELPVKIDSELSRRLGRRPGLGLALRRQRHSRRTASIVTAVRQSVTNQSHCSVVERRSQPASEVQAVRRSAQFKVDHHSRGRRVCPPQWTCRPTARGIRRISGRVRPRKVLSCWRHFQPPTREHNRTVPFNITTITIPQTA